MTQSITSFQGAALPKIQNANGILRANILLRFSQQDLGLLTNGAWQEMLNQLHQVVYFGIDMQIGREPEMFKSATRETLRQVQQTLSRLLNAWTKKGPRDEWVGIDADAFYLPVAKQRLIIMPVFKQNEFAIGYRSDHLPTQLYNSFAELLRWIKPNSILTCDNDKCRTSFIPLRKPHAGKPAYCSPRCANRMAAIQYRKRRGEALKLAERQRNSKRYDDRVRRKPGHHNSMISKRPRKPK